METGTLRTVPFKEVYESIVSRLGLDPSQAVPHNLWQAIPRNINKRLRTAWTYWEWPYLEQCDERAFARTWLSDHQFMAGELVIYVPDLKYYRAKGDPGDDPPVLGAPPTNATYWDPVTDYGSFVAFDQICRRPLGMVLGVYKGDPRSNGCGCSPGLNYRPQANGVAVCGAAGPTVYVKYQLPVPRFSLTPYAPGRAYKTGNLVYDSTSGECYIAVDPSQNEAPPNAVFWARQSFPAVFEDYVVAAAYASCLKEQSQAAEGGDNQQMRMMWARDAEAEAEDKLVEEIDKLKAMGQRFHYRAWKQTCHAHAPGVCSSEPCFDPTQGALVAPPVTTLRQICESDPTAYQPPGELPGGGEGGIEVISGVTQLLEDQAYIDVTFLVPQANANWIFVECHVVNTTDETPLNIWPGIISSKTAEGFRLQLSGAPDSGNYYLHWSITAGAAAPPAAATMYLFSGPSSGPIGAPSAAFAVELPSGSTVPAPVTVTPSDGGAGGTFTPTSRTLTTAAPSATFTYTPASYGARMISVSNDGGLTDPGSKAFTAVASTYTLSGPSTGPAGTPSTNFTVALPVGGELIGTATVTPHDGGAGGTFTPTSVGLTTAAPSATFTYTPASVGAKTISVTNNKALTNPGNLTYTATTPSLADGDPVSTWPDSSGNGHDAAMTGSNRPTFKTAIVGGKPVVRFTVAGSSKLNLASTISGVIPYTIFAVMKPLGAAGSVSLSSLMANTSVNPCGPFFSSAAGNTTVYIGDRSNIDGFNGNALCDGGGSAGFHVLTAQIQASVPQYAGRVDGTIGTSITTVANPTAGDFSAIGYVPTGLGYSDGDLAEIIIYNSVLSGTDRANIEKYLGTKYGITVAGGSAVQPDTVTGLVGWWKADSLG